METMQLQPAEADDEPSPTADEVEGYGGTLLKACSDGLIETPKPMAWNAWQTWRSRVGLRPASRRSPANVKREAVLWRSTMAELYADEWRELISTPSQHRGAGETLTGDGANLAGGARPEVHRLTPSATSAGLRTPVQSLADVAAGQVVLRAARPRADDNVSAFSEGSWRGMSDQDLWQMVKAPFDAEVDDISQYERRLLRAQALLSTRGLVADAAWLRAELQARMVRAQFQDRYHKLGERAEIVMRKDLAECMEADDDDALAQDRAEIILDLVQERGGLTEATVRDAVRTPAKVQPNDDIPTMAAAPMTPTRKTLLA